jgi:hypothetical protein
MELLAGMLGKTVRRRALCAALLLSCAVAGWAQRRDPYDPAQRGNVVIWIVSPDPDPRFRTAQAQASATPWPPQYQEQTAGSFGQTAGGYGQTAGSVGQTMGSFGDSASSTGQTSGSYGQTAGSFGNNAGSVGRNAGDAGKTMGEFGVSTTELPQAAAKANTLNRAPPKFKRDAAWATFAVQLHLSHPGFSIRFVDVFDTELKAKLTAAAGTDDYPDLLAWSQTRGLRLRIDAAWLGQQLVTNLWTPLRWAQTEEVPESTKFRPGVFLLAGARNPDAARALFVWLADGDWIPPAEPLESASESVGEIAAVVLSRLLQGGTVGPDADPQMAARDVRAEGAVQSSQVEIRTDVKSVHLAANSAVVTLRGVASGAHEFGVINVVMVLRKDGQGRWGVLQVSPGLTSGQQQQAADLLVEGGGSPGANQVRTEGAKALGISQAAPPDGDRRPPQPELWWDNLGGATLQVVEWQYSPGPLSNLFFVPDNGIRLRTRVIARFATAQRQYRWRVWSIGPDETIVVSPWRTLIIGAG